MKKTRKNLLDLAWTGAPLTIAGNEICLSHGRRALLASWGNSLFDSKNTDQNQSDAMGEIVMVCSATKNRLMEIRGMTDSQRKQAVVEFMLDNEDELDAVFEGVADRLQAIAAANVEPATPGKPEE